jgi:cytochrome P450
VRSTHKTESAVLELLLDASTVKGHIVPSAAELTEEALTLLVAGNDTTATAMILGLYQICRSPDIQNKVEAEIRTAFSERKEFVSFCEARKLPYLVSPKMLPEETLAKV